jgi:hypothetical protein
MHLIWLTLVYIYIYIYVCTCIYIYIYIQTCLHIWFFLLISIAWDIQCLSVASPVYQGRISCEAHYCRRDQRLHRYFFFSYVVFSLRNQCAVKITNYVIIQYTVLSCDSWFWQGITLITLIPRWLLHWSYYFVPFLYLRHIWPVRILHKGDSFHSPVVIFEF